MVVRQAREAGSGTESSRPIRKSESSVFGRARGNESLICSGYHSRLQC